MKELKDDEYWISKIHQTDGLSETRLDQVKKIHAKQKAINDYKAEQRRLIAEKIKGSSGKPTSDD